MLRSNETFLTEMDQTLRKINKDPLIRSRALQSLSQLDSRFSQSRFEDDQEYNQVVRDRLRAVKKRARYENDKEIDFLVSMSARQSAMHASNLKNLLQPKWTEDKS